MKHFDEKTLVTKLDKILIKEFGTNLAFHEFSAGYGIADIVFAPDFSFRRKSIDRTPITDFNVLSVLLALEEQKDYNISTLLDLFPHLNTNELKKVLRTLISGGYMEEIVNSQYRKTVSDEFNPIQKIVAIEVKLTDHKSGLIQARRYQYFADQSYLAILKESEKNIDYTEFEKFNIGLILFDSTTNSIEIRHPLNMNNNYENTVSLFAKEMMLDRFISNAS